MINKITEDEASKLREGAEEWPIIIKDSTEWNTKTRHLSIQW